VLLLPHDLQIMFLPREMLSKTDCMKINSLYKCFGDQALNRKIQIICAMVGI
jgi:hypothetical protein